MISKIREVLQKHKEAIPVAAMAEILSVMDEVEANNKWIPCGQTWPYPGERVQVTYKGLVNGDPLCDAMAFIDPDGNWHWDDVEGTLAAVEITAWKRPGEPYRVEE